MSTRPRRGPAGWVLPAILVVAGIVALLANVGAISWDQVDRLGDLWPLLVILLGMWLILGAVAAHGTRDVVMLILVLVMAAASVGYVAAGPAGGQSLDASAPLAGAEAGRLAITGGAATAHLQVGDTGDDLYRATLRWSGSQRPQVTNGQGEATIDFGSGSTTGFFGLRREATVTLSDQVPWTISVDGGALTVTGDLSSGKLAHLEVSGGASHVDLRLPAPSGDVALSFDGGALQVQLHRPAETQMRVTVTGGASTITGDGHHVSTLGSDATWQSPGWDGAADRYTVTVSGGASGVVADTY